jgi:hypothetical protein
MILKSFFFFFRYHRAFSYKSFMLFFNPIIPLIHPRSEAHKSQSPRSWTGFINDIINNTVLDWTLPDSRFPINPWYAARIQLSHPLIVSVPYHRDLLPYGRTGREGER